jgi:hypothetical protein
MVEFGRLEKGGRPPDKPLEALRCPAQTRHDGKIFETYPQGKAFGSPITYLRWTCGLPFKKHILLNIKSECHVGFRLVKTVTGQESRAEENYEL